MAGIYSQGGSSVHRYAGWLSEVEAKNFTFGGKVFNGSPSAIYVGSNLVWKASPYSKAATKALMDAFPTQWEIIKDYGLAHPEIVPWVNARPVMWGGIIVDYGTNLTTMLNNYQRCEYIESSGAGLLLPIKFNTMYSYEMDYIFIGNGWIAGANAGLKGSGYGFAANHYRCGNKYVDYPTLTTDVMLLLQYGPQEVVIEGISYPMPSGLTDSTSQDYLSLFKCTEGSSLAGMGKFGRFVARDSNNNDLIYLFACYHKANGTIGMFNLVNGTFLSGTFTKGPDV